MKIIFKFEAENLSTNSSLETPFNTKTLKINLSSLQKMRPQLSPSLSDLDGEEELQFYKINDSKNILNNLESDFSCKNRALYTFSLISFDNQEKKELQKIDEIQLEKMLNLIKQKGRVCQKMPSRKQLSYLKQICLKSNQPTSSQSNQ